MAFLSNMIMGPSAKFTAQGVPIQEGANVGQANELYGQGQQGIEHQRDFLQALAAQGGINNQANVFAQQQALANQLQQMSTGGGPNPAAAQLAQATGANVANQAALMAGQRGAGANAGLLARQAGMQGANIQQQAAGQAATMQAQQQLAAMNALQQQQASMANLSGQQVGQLGSANQAYNQAVQGAQGQVLGAIGNQNNANVNMQSNLNSANSGFQTGQNAAQANVAGGLLNGAGAALGAFAKPAAAAGAGGGLAGAGEGLAGAAMFAARGGMIESNGPSSFVGQHLCGMKSGGPVPGKAAVKGDSYANDTVPAVLSPGEVVIPRHVMQSKDPAKAAAEFVRQVLAKKKSVPKVAFAAGGEATDEGMAGTPEPAVETPPTENNFSTWQPTQPAAPSSNLISGQPGDLNFSNWQPKEMEGMGNPTMVASNSDVPQGALSPETGAAAPAMPSASTPAPDLTGGYGKAFGEYRSGLNMEAKAQGDLGKAESQVANQSATDLQNLQANYEKSKSKLDQERQGLIQDISNNHLDPNRYMGSLSTGGKVATALGLIVGGIGAGMTHSENLAMKFLNQQIENDITAQKADLGKKQSLLDANYKQFGNLQDATSMTRVNMLDMTSMKLKEMAAKAQDPISKARALQAAGQLDMQAAPIMNEIALKQSIVNGVKKGNVEPTMLIDHFVPKEERKEHYDQLKDAQEWAKRRDSALEGFERVNDSKTLAKMLKNPREAAAFRNQMNDVFAEISHKLTGKYNPEETKLLKDQYEPLLTDSPEILMVKKRGLMALVDRDANFPRLKKLEAYGFNPFSLSRYDTKGMRRIQESAPRIGAR